MDDKAPDGQSISYSGGKYIYSSTSIVLKHNFCILAFYATLYFH